MKEKIRAKLSEFSENPHFEEMLDRIWLDYVDYASRKIDGGYVLWNSPTYQQAIVYRDGALYWVSKPHFYGYPHGEKQEYPSYREWKAANRVAADMTATMTEPGKSRFWRSEVDWENWERL